LVLWEGILLAMTTAAPLRVRDVLFLSCAIGVWGANWTVMKLALGHSTPLWIGALRYILGAATLFAILAARGGVRPPPRGDIPIVVSVGLLQMLVNSTLIIFALRFVPPGRSSVLGYATPLWVVPLAMLLGERPTARILGGTFLGLAGMALLFSPTSLDWGDRQVVFGQVLLMLAAIAWSICIIHIRGHRWQASPLDLAPWQMLLAAAPLALAALIVDGPAPGDFSPAFWTTALYIGVFATAFAFWAVTEATRRLSPTTTSNAMLAVPVMGLIFSAYVTGERIDLWLVVGMAMMLAGIAVVASARRR
jgi:drug/metabolite transporter (DMT)-like permease